MKAAKLQTDRLDIMEFGFLAMLLQETDRAALSEENMMAFKQHL
jgi:hypothetical protein